MRNEERKLIRLFIYICVLLTLSLPIQKLLKACDADASHVLHLCFDNITEYDPDLVFDFYETCLHSSVDKKQCLNFK